MIKINGEVLNTKKFPDGTLLIKEDVPYNFENYREATITWLFENNEELVTLIYIVKHLNWSDALPICRTSYAWYCKSVSEYAIYPKQSSRSC